MKVTGIIAEYNPFHNGHAYQLKEAKKLTGADYIIVVMSGDFMQRGTPAIIDKYSRAQMALEGGADIVFELPTAYACSSAEYFAKGAVHLLHSLGVVDYICFGSECGDIEILDDIAAFLIDEPIAFQDTIKYLTKQGNSYPKARAFALQEHFQSNNSYLDCIKSPNNILGIEYIKALRLFKSTIKPVTLKRMGADYHDENIAVPTCSALAIRTALFLDKKLDLIRNQVPKSTLQLLEKEWSKSFPITLDDYSILLSYQLLKKQAHGFDRYADITPDLSARISKLQNNFSSFTDFCDVLKTKDATYSRINRCLIHILLELKQEDVDYFISHDISYYGRILGFKKESQPLLKAIKDSSLIPVISKLADAPSNLSKEGLSLLQYDIFASNLYQQVVVNKYNCKPINEYCQNIIRI